MKVFKKVHNILFHNTPTFKEKSHNESSGLGALSPPISFKTRMTSSLENSLSNDSLPFIEVLEKYMSVSHIKHTRRKINGFTSFAIDNMHYVNFRIYEQESVPWCGEFQNKDYKYLRTLLIFTPIPLDIQEVWSLNYFIYMCSRENKRVSNTHIQTISFSYKILYVFLFITDYLIGLIFWAIPIGL